MEIYKKRTEEEMGVCAADLGAQAILQAIKKNGSARIILATGASQFAMLEQLVKKEIPWNHVEMYHLDEYCDLPITHKASFRKYLKERFIDIVHPAKIHLIDGEGDVESHILNLTGSIRSRPIDVAFIGIGENGHIAFNDPPADFETHAAYIVVNLDQDCKNQQVSEGWFPSIKEVPDKAISMTVHQILEAKKIICTVPGARKAKAIQATLMSKNNDPMIPASALWNHADCALVLDEESAALI
jgi:glucosamine-6-phosphate deaminase